MTESVIKEIENRIKSNSFNSKEELVNYLNSLRQNNQIDINLLNERYMSLLKLYDDTMTASDSLNISNYKNASLEDKNFIVSSNDGRVLESNSNTPLKEEFESVQNEMAVNGENGIANADQVFNYMEKYKKTEASLMPLSNLNINIIDADMLEKIKFFISNNRNNIFDYKVDISRGLFINVNTNDIYEVRKNPETGQFEIFKGGSAMYLSTPEMDPNGNDVERVNEIPEMTDEELETYINNNHLSQAQIDALYERQSRVRQAKQTKVKKLVRVRNNALDNAAFAKLSLLSIIIVISSVLFAYLLLSLK